MTTHEVISAFLDDESFELGELEEALSDPAGRAFLIDSMALRRLVQPIEPAPRVVATRLTTRRPWRLAAAAAVLLLTLASGYVIGGRRAATISSEAPPPSRMVQAVPFVPTGGLR